MPTEESGIPCQITSFQHLLCRKETAARGVDTLRAAFYVATLMLPTCKESL